MDYIQYIESIKIVHISPEYALLAYCVGEILLFNQQIDKALRNKGDNIKAVEYFEKFMIRE